MNNTFGPKPTLEQVQASPSPHWVIRLGDGSEEEVILFIVDGEVRVDDQSIREWLKDTLPLSEYLDEILWANLNLPRGLEFGPKPTPELAHASANPYWVVQLPDGSKTQVLILDENVICLDAPRKEELKTVLDQDLLWVNHKMTLADFGGTDFPPLGTRVRSQARAHVMGTVTQHLYELKREDRFDSFLIEWDDPNTPTSHSFVMWGQDSKTEVVYVPGAVKP